jgi:hypothetical protein
MTTFPLLLFLVATQSGVLTGRVRKPTVPDRR